MLFLCKNLTVCCSDNTQFAQKWLSLCYLYLVTTASAWRKIIRCIGLVRQSSYWKPRHQTSFRPHCDYRTVRTWVQWTTQSGRWCKKMSTNIDSKTLASCVSELCLQEMNLISEWLTRQSSSGELVFTLASKGRSACPNELWLTCICCIFVHLRLLCLLYIAFCFNEVPNAC